MRAREYRVLEEAVEAGIQYGWNRAHKHTDSPREQETLEQIEQAVLHEVCERFRFEDEDEHENDYEGMGGGRDSRWGPGSRVERGSTITGGPMDFLRSKLEGWKTYGTAWAGVLVVAADLLGWYDVPSLESTPAILGAAVVAALVVTFGKAGITRDIARATSSPEA